MGTPLSHLLRKCQLPLKGGAKICIQKNFISATKKSVDKPEPDGYNGNNK